MRNWPRLAIIVIALIGAGCHRGHSLVGKWSSSMEGQAQTIEFTADSKVILSADIPQPPLTATVTGTYTLDNDSLATKFTDMSLQAKDPSIQPLIDSKLPSLKPAQLDMVNKHSPNGKLTWKTEDEVSAPVPDGTVKTMTRIKS